MDRYAAKQTQTGDRRPAGGGALALLIVVRVRGLTVNPNPNLENGFGSLRFMGSSLGFRINPP